LTEAEEKQGFGTLIERNGKTYIKIGQSETSAAFMISTPFEKDWSI
jgi:hypothetical protein